MLCQKCGLTEATVHLETAVFRQKIEEHLCAICAGARGPAAQGIQELLGRPARLSDYE
jgi:protein-arginine kinase activator protein McsA